MRLFGVGLVELLIALAILIAFVAIATSFARRRRGSGIWSPLHWFGVLVAAALVVVLQVGCTPTQPTQPPNITIIAGNGNGNISNPGGTPSSPAPGSNGAIATVKVGAFGITCPGSVKLPNSDRTIPVGCTMAVTCTPKDVNGQLVGPAVTGPSPDFFDAVNGKGTVVKVAAWDEEAFNVNVTGLSPGAFALSCVSKGVKSDAWAGDVVAPTASGLDHVEAMSRVIYDPEITLRDFSLWYLERQLDGPVR